ncbi:DUF805 domain-containing protein [Aureivirga sp. CE67]|uniref:DUF805 domain-containing protein n=1 Tax=Aureivirga sp. CE67 TaxID=1788983 RepID=UPI0018C9C6D4|nr:DUF805 domain-containing protein [Aureivirga sp. CE67]
MNYYLKAFQQYTDFDSRVSRKEFWIFAIISASVSYILMGIDIIFSFYSQDVGLGVLSGIYSILVFIPSLAITIRRLHDIGKSGWFILLVFIPLIGAIGLFILLLLKSESGRNQYGENPIKLKKNKSEDEISNEIIQQKKHKTSIIIALIIAFTIQQLFWVTVSFIVFPDDIDDIIFKIFDSFNIIFNFIITVLFILLATTITNLKMRNIALIITAIAFLCAFIHFLNTVTRNIPGIKSIKNIISLI